MERLPRDDDGRLSKYAWPGGYKIVYFDHEGSWLCADCARKSDEDPEEIPQFKPLHGDIYWEGPHMYCEDCNAKIESEYGDPDEED